MITIQPTIGIRLISCHHPLRLVSCSLRVAAAMIGNKVPSENRMLTKCAIDAATRPPTKQNNANHQYSERVALPLKSAYFEKQTLIDSENVILCSTCCFAILAVIPGEAKSHQRIAQLPSQLSLTHACT